MAHKSNSQKIRDVARVKLGFERLRPGQEEAVEAILGDRDALVVQPTGSGKSAIYQIAGLLLEGATVVVSPMIALQKDQVDSTDGTPLAHFSPGVCTGIAWPKSIGSDS